MSGHTRLVFVRSSDAADHEALNLRAFENLLNAVEDEGGGTYVLNKIQGVSHGGGAQVPAGSADFANMQRFLGLLGEPIARVRLTPETLFNTVRMASPRKTLRRAALIFAGRLPTEAEYAAVEGGDETALRATIRGLMEGPEFHEFLIRASNDRLLTDRDIFFIIDPTSDVEFVDFANEHYRRKAARANGNEREFYDWIEKAQYGFRRAPLELIAHVAENDLPYTELLTANYIMANPWAAAAYGASTRFDDSRDPYEFRPSKIVSYYRKGEGFEDEYDPILQASRVLNPGPLSTTYPHAGILNTTSFLIRYPTTATNRNRARARWTYYHFLGLDGESAPNPDNSVQWLARRIVADERFAEAAVKFWWPAIMGSEVTETPEDERDADFEGRLLAANAQGAEVARLAGGFRRGFQGSSYTYNLKDLLVEIVLSKWFRADAVSDADAVLRVALHDAGARRLLTPEELARKTAAITGVQWGRRPASRRFGSRYVGSFSELTGDYRLLYGGIDSDGITERAGTSRR